MQIFNVNFFCFVYFFPLIESFGDFNEKFFLWFCECARKVWFFLLILVFTLFLHRLRFFFSFSSSKSFPRISERVWKKDCNKFRGAIFFHFFKVHHLKIFTRFLFFQLNKLFFSYQFVFNNSFFLLFSSIRLNLLLHSMRTKKSFSRIF